MILCYIVEVLLVTNLSIQLLNCQVSLKVPIIFLIIAIQKFWESMLAGGVNSAIWKKRHRYFSNGFLKNPDCCTKIYFKSWIMFSSFYQSHCFSEFSENWYGRRCKNKKIKIEFNELAIWSHFAQIVIFVIFFELLTYLYY